MDHNRSMRRWSHDVNFIEEGDVYFFYKPKKTVEKVQNLDGVARFFFVLDPYGDSPPRYIVMGNKKMPEVVDGGNTTWGFVQMVGGRGFETYHDSTKPAKSASRPVGEGIYTIIEHRGHTHFLYSLELPQTPGEVQKVFTIQKEANYIIAERPIETTPRNPDAPFSNFTPATSNNLNLRGTEILLIGVGADIGRLGIKVDGQTETFDTADIFSNLKVSSIRHPTKSLTSGKWE